MKNENILLKCPWNNFDNCYRNSCPYYGILGIMTTGDSKSTSGILQIEEWGCTRVLREDGVYNNTGRYIGEY
jgi:hypothetical protein